MCKIYFLYINVVESVRIEERVHEPVLRLDFSKSQIKSYFFNGSASKMGVKGLTLRKKE